MSAVAYAMRDLYPSSDGTARPGAVSVPRHRGGCGVPHEVSPTPDKRYVVECDQCAPVLIGGSYGWSSDAAGVPQTPDELRANDLASRDAHAAQATVMSAMTEAFVKAINQGGIMGATGEPVPAPTPPSLIEQIATLSAEDRAQLAALLATPAAAPAADEDDGADLTPAAVKPPVRKGPGRPRTVR